MVKQSAVTNDVRPVRPPSLTPDALSTNVVTVLVPMMAPAVVPIASTRNACLSRGILPLVMIPAFVHTPMSVPIVSKRSTKRNVKTMTNMSVVKILSHSNLKNMGDIEGGVEKMPL